MIKKIMLVLLTVHVSVLLPMDYAATWAKGFSVLDNVPRTPVKDDDGGTTAHGTRTPNKETDFVFKGMFQNVNSSCFSAVDALLRAHPEYIYIRNEKSRNKFTVIESLLLAYKSNNRYATSDYFATWLLYIDPLAEANATLMQKITAAVGEDATLKPILDQFITGAQAKKAIASESKKDEEKPAKESKDSVLRGWWNWATGRKNNAVPVPAAAESTRVTKEPTTELAATPTQDDAEKKEAARLEQEEQKRAEVIEIERKRMQAETERLAKEEKQRADALENERKARQEQARAQIAQYKKEAAIRLAAEKKAQEVAAPAQETASRPEVTPLKEVGVPMTPQSTAPTIQPVTPGGSDALEKRHSEKNLEARARIAQYKKEVAEKKAKEDAALTRRAEGTEATPAKEVVVASTPNQTPVVHASTASQQKAPLSDARVALMALREKRKQEAQAIAAQASNAVMLKAVKPSTAVEPVVQTPKKIETRQEMLQRLEREVAQAKEEAKRRAEEAAQAKEEAKRAAEAARAGEEAKKLVESSK